MNYLKTDTVGVDSVIKKLQTKVYNGLNTIWGNVDGYGRVYRNPKGDKVIPEVYTINGNYKEVLMDDAKDSMFFFDVHPNYKLVTTNYGVANVDIIVFINLKKTKGLNQRNDHEAHKDLMKILKFKPYGFETKELHTTIDSVYKEFKGISEMLKNKDMSYYHHFKISGSLSFSINNC